MVYDPYSIEGQLDVSFAAKVSDDYLRLFRIPAPEAGGPGYGLALGSVYLGQSIDGLTLGQ